MSTSKTFSFGTGLRKTCHSFSSAIFWKSQFLKKYSNDICVDSNKSFCHVIESQILSYQKFLNTSAPILNRKFDWTRCNFLSGKCLRDKNLK